VANTARDGLASAYLFDEEVPFLLGIPRGRCPFGQWTNGRPNPEVTSSGELLAGARVAHTPGVGTANNVARVGTASSYLTSPDADWFDRVHLKPRAGIAFGNIVAQTEQSYELYSAWRESTATLVSIANNATPGIELPGLTSPRAFPRETSAVDASSTSNNGGTGLGTVVQLKVRALVDGLPQFDTTIDFTFDTGQEISLPVSGQRIVLVPLEYEVDLVEVLSFRTDVHDALSGKNKRLALRDNPRQLFEADYVLEGDDRQRMEMLLLDWLDNVFAVPMWHEALRLTAATSVGATQYLVTGADEVDIRVGGLALVITDAATFDVLNVTAVTPTQVTASSAAAFGYPVGTMLLPLRTAIVAKVVEGSRPPKNAQLWRITYEVTDNETGALTGTTTPGFWSTYNGRVLLSDPNFVSGSMSEEVRRRVHRIDNLTGRVTQASNWDRSKRGSHKGFVLNGRAAIMQARRLLLALAGRQKAFYVPTFAEDLTVRATLSSGTNTMDINRIGYVRHAQDREPKKRFRITFTDDTTLERTISSSIEVDALTERLTLNTTWPATRLASEVSRVEFYELVLFDADEFRIRYPRSGLARLEVPLVTAFDDN
jgi:hypothetical protein